MKILTRKRSPTSLNVTLLKNHDSLKNLIDASNLLRNVVPRYMHSLKKVSNKFYFTTFFTEKYLISKKSTKHTTTFQISFFFRRSPTSNLAENSKFS